MTIQAIKRRLLTSVRNIHEVVRIRGITKRLAAWRTILFVSTPVYSLYLPLSFLVFPQIK